MDAGANDLALDSYRRQRSQRGFDQLTHGGQFLRQSTAWRVTGDNWGTRHRSLEDLLDRHRLKAASPRMRNLRNRTSVTT